MFKILKSLILIGRELNLVRLMLQDFHQAHFPDSEVYKNTKNYKFKLDYSKTYDDESSMLDVNFEQEVAQQEKEYRQHLGLD